MAIKGLLFDLYGTLIDIETDEGMEEIYRGIAHFLTYHGVHLHRWEVRDHYYRIMDQQRDQSGEEYPEVIVEDIWDALLKEQGMRPASARFRLTAILAQLYRGISRKRLRLYPGVKETLDVLRGSYHLALVSDAQPCFARPEIRAVGLEGYFDPVVISAEYGFRKPDSRLFQAALEGLKLNTREVIFVGNDMYRDIFGASRLGIKTIFFASNQGTRSHPDTSPSCRITDFGKLPEAIKTLDGEG
jgi:putative hydrolase of the HAD superfamily